MDTQPKRRIVVGIDYSAPSDLALTRAFELSSAEPESELHLVHAIVPPVAPYVVLGPTTVADGRATLVRYARKQLADFTARYPELGQPGPLFYHVTVDDPAFEIAHLAAQLQADLIVVGTHARRALARFLWGSVAEVVVRLAPCPVLVVRPKASPPAAHAPPPTSRSANSSRRLRRTPSRGARRGL